MEENIKQQTEKQKDEAKNILLLIPSNPQNLIEGIEFKKYPNEKSEDDQKELRERHKKSITASKIAQISGCDKYKDSFDALITYFDESLENTETIRGHEREPKIIGKLIRMTKNKIAIRHCGYFVHEKEPNFNAKPDAIASLYKKPSKKRKSTNSNTASPLTEEVVIEIKSVRSMVTQPKDLQIHLQHIFQVTWQMACTGLKYAVLVYELYDEKNLDKLDNEQKFPLKCWIIEYNEDLYKWLSEKAKIFLEYLNAYKSDFTLLDKNEYPIPYLYYEIETALKNDQWIKSDDLNENEQLKDLWNNQRDSEWPPCPIIIELDPSLLPEVYI